MNSIFDGVDNYLDPDNPEDRRILEKRSIAQAWEQRISERNLSAVPETLSDREFGLQLPSIWSVYSISRDQLGSYPNRNAWVRHLQEVAIRVLERRQLFFPAKHAYAIANADEPDDKAIHLEYAGICIRLDKGFDMTLPVTPSRETDADDFDLLFAARLAKTAPLSVGNFLEYHLSKNFRGNFQGFKSYLQLLFLQYGMAGATPGTSAMPLLTDAIGQAVQIWLSQQAQQSGTGDHFKINLKDKSVEDALFNALAPYFSKDLHAPLQILTAGGPSETPLFFSGTCSQFVHVFQEACEMGLIVSSKIEVRDWIVQNFLFRHTRTKESSDFSPGLVYKILTKQIPVKRPIDISSLQRLKEV